MNRNKEFQWRPIDQTLIGAPNTRISTAKEADASLQIAWNIVYFVVVVMAALGLVAFICLMVQNQDTSMSDMSDAVAMLQMQVTEKCAEVLELQVMSNNSADIGVAVGVDGTVNGNTFVTWTTDFWDDANFWSAGADADKIFLPQAGRYAIGFICRDSAFSPSNDNLFFRLRFENGMGNVVACEFPQLDDDQSTTIGSRVAGYCEQEFTLLGSEYLRLQVTPPGTSFIASSNSCRLTVRRVGPATGNGLIILS